MRHSFARPLLIVAACLLIIIAAALLLPAFPSQAIGKKSGSSQGQSDWVQQGFNREHTGLNPFEKVLNATNVSHLRQDWVYYPPSKYAPSQPVVANGIVYFSSQDGNVYAVNAATGQLLWSYTTSERSDASPAVTNGFVYIGTAGGHLYALKASTGQLMWKYATGNTIDASPLIANGLVYMGASNGILYALNGTTGTVVWRYSFGSIFPTPSIDSSSLYLSAKSTLYALSVRTGRLLWHVPVNGGTPVIANGVIYLSSSAAGLLSAFNEHTGALLWSRNIAVSSDPSVANGIVYVDAACNLDALNATTGAVVWSYSTVDTAYCVETVSAIANGVVYAGGSPTDPGSALVFMFNATTGAVLSVMDNGWTGSANDIASSPVVVNGTLYIAADDGGLYAFHLSTAS